MTRREWLRVAGLAAGAWSFGTRGAGSMMQALEAVDHLLLGAADLERGMAWLESRTGVRAEPGGSHPGRGTRNALASLGGRRYLEIIAPDPAQTTYQFHLDVRDLDAPRLITWAAAVPDLDALAGQARAAGHQVFGPADGSRARPDGAVLRWRTAGVQTRLGQRAIEPVPFFIEWSEGTEHPSRGAPAGCVLERLAIEHPEPSRARDVLRSLGLEMSVGEGPAATLTATVQTPKGRVVLE